MADYPLPQFGEKTCVEIAETPNLDYLSFHGELGLVQTIPPGFSPGSDVAAMSLLGFNPKVYYTGRAPLEAASMGINLDGDITAFRCNLITTNDNILEDYSAGHITNEEAKKLVSFLDEKFGTDSIKFYAGISYRHITTFQGAEQCEIDVYCTPPHDIMGQSIDENLPKGNGAELLIKLMKDSRAVLSNHDVNKKRVINGKNPANMIWLWGQGKKPLIPLFYKTFGLKCAVISAVDLIKGLASIMGMDVINVPGATGNIDTDYDAKAEYAINAFKNNDMVVVHIEAPDEMGHNGNAKEKVKAIENIDKKIIGPILNFLKSSNNFRLLALPDHYTPIALRTHSREPVPFAIYGNGIEKGGGKTFTEKHANETQLKIEYGYKLMSYFLKVTGAD